MIGRDWNNLGQDLNRIIEDAVHMGNFGRLNQNINDALKRAFQTDSGNQEWDFNLSKEDENSSKTKDNTWQKEENIKKPVYAEYKPAPVYFVKKSKRRGGAIAKLIIGILFAISGFNSAVLFLAGAFIGPESIGIAGAVIGLALLAVGVIFIVNAAGTLKLATRFEQYIKCLRGNNFIDIEKLAVYCHRDRASILKDLKKMFGRGWFPEGHLDHKETCLMVSHEAYEQYLTAVKNAEMQAEEKRRQREEDAGKTGMTPEARAVIDKGHEYIRAIRESNDAIPGEEISEKMYQMELLVKRIFEQVEAHPENISDLRKLMEYYLPMTMKLLKAYEELDKQPVQGENIMSSKEEIEKTLVTLNEAFAKLLDNLFQDTAWDVSSDISVLKTMLAQEGLKKDDFTNK